MQSLTHILSFTHSQQRQTTTTVERAERLSIQFYEATYNPSFASIFATEDICALVPKEQAHVCILEEPEHLNWMRIVNEDADNDEPQQQPEEEEKKDVDCHHEKTNEQDTTTSATTTSTLTIDVVEMNQLGWQAKFDFVVGILHTNYDAYVRQYGVGAAFFGASALHALSALCTRAYCHRVIRLSDTLPTLDAPKEVTCNVHGVLMEFLQDPPLPPSSPTTTTTSETTPMPSPELCQDKQEENDPALASIYFIGKLVRLPIHIIRGVAYYPSRTVVVIIVFVQCAFSPFRCLDLGQGIR